MNLLNSHNSMEVSPIITSILQMRKVELREVERQGHRANNNTSWDVNSDNLAPESPWRKLEESCLIFLYD